MTKTICIALLPFLLFAETSLWKISKGANYLYIGGTIHLLRPSDYPLPSEFEKAFNEAQTIVFETNLAEMKTPEFQSRLIAAVSYPAGRTLRGVLNAETYQKLNAYLQQKGLPFSAINQFRPSMVSILLTQWEMVYFGMAEEGVDLYFYHKAIAQKKRTVGLETTDQQISYIASLGEDDPNGLIQNTIDEVSTIESTISTMISSWKTGNTDILNDLIVKEMKEKYPSIHQSLLVDRNFNWKPEIITMITTPPVELILVGAGHLVGEEGLLKIFEKDGYTVEKAIFKKP